MLPEHAQLGARLAEEIGKPGQADALGRLIGRLVADIPEKAHLLADVVDRAARVYSGGNHVSSPAALLRTMYENEPLRDPGPARPPVRVLGPGAAPPSRPLDPRVAAVPAWAGADAEAQAVIRTLLDELEHSGPLKGRKSWIKHYAAEGHTGFRLAEQRHPELRRIAEDGWEAYLDEATAPAVEGRA